VENYLQFGFRPPNEINIFGSGSLKKIITDLDPEHWKHKSWKNVCGKISFGPCFYQFERALTF
jgi:hypothetical protein